MKAQIDDEDFELVYKHNWRIATTNSGQEVRSSTRPYVYLARYIIESYKGKLPKYILTDHVDRNIFNCQKYNIRLASHSENAINSSKRIDNTSGYKGVSITANGKYRAYIQVNKKWLSLGTHDSIIDAAKAYNTAARKYFGSFARLNSV